jgi:hypothetical protein
LVTQGRDLKPIFARAVLVAAADPSERIVKLWDAETGSFERTLDCGGAQH